MSPSHPKALPRYPLLEDPRAVMLDALRIRFAVEFNGQSNYVQRPQRTMCSGHKELCAVAKELCAAAAKNYVQRPQRTRDADASAWYTSPCSARRASERWSMWRFGSRFGIGALQRFDSCYCWLAGCLRPKDI